MRRASVLLVGMVLGAFALPAATLAYVSPGQPQGYVNDFAGILSEDTRSMLETELQAFEASTTIEFAVVTVESLGGDDIADYGYQLGREWGVGKKDTNNGLLLIVAPNERKVRVEVGYGLEGAVTDIGSGQIIESVILPAFRDGDYDAGVIEGVHALEQLAQGEYTAEPVPQWKGFGLALLENMPAIPILILIILMYAGSIFARSKSWWLGGALGAIAGAGYGFFAKSLVTGAFFALGLGILGAVFDFIVSRAFSRYQKTGEVPLAWLGGMRGLGGDSFGSRSSGGGSGGGGSFGGGSFGGGGSSGSC